MAAPLYRVTPIRPFFGAEVRGIDLKSANFTPELVAKIKEDVKKHRLLVFKEQGKVPGERQVQLSALLGDVESTFYKHPRSPHPDIFRVSNSEAEGCTNVGRTGWHVDGTFQPSPFKYQTMHFHAVCKGGGTAFVPLKELYERQSEDVRRRWDALWFVAERSVMHPLVYVHPIRKDTTMLFHCGRPFCAGWKDTASNSFISAAVVQDELTRACEEALPEIGITMEWEEGDFAINDNVGNAHYALPGTQTDPKKGGLRILHRTTIAGDTIPTKADGRQSILRAT